MGAKGYDFCGWATKNNLLCSDGRTICRDAFKEQDGRKVPIIWNHGHGSVKNVLGHAVLENRAEGVYMYGYLNDSEEGTHAKQSLKNGDITALSIYANKLKQNGGDVLHGIIREVSLVLAGANPGATIDCVLAHGDDYDEAVVYEMDEFEIHHSEEIEEEDDSMAMSEDTNKEETNSEETLQDVIDTMTDKQKEAMYALIGLIAENKGADNDNEGGDNNMKHNVFEGEEKNNQVLCHAEIEEIFEDARRYGSLKDATLAHAANNGYGIEDIDVLFPDAKASSNEPEEIRRDTTWVGKFFGAADHSPFSRVKTTIANITEEDARARGYIKGKRKKEMVFTLAKRKTDPQTVYVKSKLDRDDISDITDFDIAAYQKKQLDIQLNEEIARAGLVGDGRSTASEDHISHDHIRPIWTDDDLFTIKVLVSTPSGSTAAQKTQATIDAIIRSRKKYKGSGNPILFTTDDFVTDCLLLKDSIGHDLYENEEKLARKLRVSEIVAVPVMEGLTRDVNGVTRNLIGIIVNPKDYRYGSDKGGKKSFFQNFDIDFNQEKALLEGRCSGAMTKPFAAIAIEQTWVAGFGMEGEDEDTTVLGKLVGDLQEDIIVNDKSIEGVLKYVTGYTGYSGDEADQSGNFLALAFTPAAGATVTLETIGGSHNGRVVTLDSDNQAVIRVENNSQKLKVTSTVSGEEPVVKVYSFRLLELAK